MATYDSLPAGFKLQTFDQLPSGFTIKEEEEESPFAPFQAASKVFEPLQQVYDALPKSMEEAGQSLKAGAGGFTESFARPLYGALDWAGVDSVPGSVLSKSARKRAREALDESQEGHGFAGGAGSLAGNIAQFALPAAGAAKLVGAGRAALPAAFAADVGYGGLAGAAGAEEGQDRGEAAAKEAGLAALGGGLGATIAKLGKGFDVKPGVEKFMEAGGYLTPGQAAASKGITGLETVSGVTPFLARGVGDVTQAASESVSPTMIKQVGRRFNANIAEGGQKGIAKLKDAVNDGYADAWSRVGADAWDADTQKAFAKKIMQETKFWPADEAATLQRLVRDVDPNAAKKPAAPTNRFERPKALPKATKPKKDISLKKIDKMLRDMIDGSKDNYAFQETLIGLRGDLRDMAGESANKALNKMDSAYPDFLAVRDAAAKSRRGSFDARTLEQSSRTVGGVDKASRGLAPVQRQAEDLAEAMQKVGGEPLDFFRRIARFLPTPAPRSLMKAVGNITVGQTGWQRQIRKVLEDHPEYAEQLMAAMSAGMIEEGRE